MHKAAQGRGCTKATDALVAAGADVNAKNSHGWTPLHYAGRDGDAKEVDALTAAGADVNAKARHRAPAPCVLEWLCGGGATP